jgi:hypothetical protein
MLARYDHEGETITPLPRILHGLAFAVFVSVEAAVTVLSYVRSLNSIGSQTVMPTLFLFSASST